MRRKIRRASSSWRIASSDSRSGSHEPTIRDATPAPSDRIRRLKSRVFQGFDEFLELELVGKFDLEPARRDARVKAGQPLERGLRTSRQGRVDRGTPPPG